VHRQDNLLSVLNTNTVGIAYLYAEAINKLKIDTFVTISSRVSSISENTSSGMISYRMSKAALNMAVKSFSLEYPSKRHICICPGWTNTDMGGDSARHSVVDMCHDIIKTI
jgi:NAD(P)-dependent dehydrogenase (short-subunit alcohol dehydrogenase family)